MRSGNISEIKKLTTQTALFLHKLFSQSSMFIVQLIPVKPGRQLHLEKKKKRNAFFQFLAT